LKAIATKLLDFQFGFLSVLYGFLSVRISFSTDFFHYGFLSLRISQDSPIDIIVGRGNIIKRLNFVTMPITRKVYYISDLFSISKIY
jgi:hypothetical protein